MWNVKGQNLSMADGDYGIILPILIKGTPLTASDSVRMTIKHDKTGVVLVKEFTEIEDNTVQFKLTEEESALFHIGAYVYSLDWYHEGQWMCNIIPSAYFTVVKKI